MRRWLAPVPAARWTSQSTGRVAAKTFALPPCTHPSSLRTVTRAQATLTSSRAASKPKAKAKRRPPSPPGNTAVVAATVGGRLQFDSSKAGMQRVNKSHVQQVINKLSQGSLFFRHEQQCEAQRIIRNRAMVIQATEYMKHALPAVRKEHLLKAALFERELEAQRDLSRVFVHVDMDMFYAAVEEKKNPSLKSIPYAVGNHTMLTTSNYLARQYGVRSGMPGFIAKRLCPQLRLIPTDFPSYEAAAAEVRAIARRYDPAFVTLGLDDLTLEITAYLKAHPGMTAAQVCRQLRGDVQRETELTCSAGIAPTPAFAKMASGVNKPNGQHEVRLRTREQVLKHVKGIPVRQVPGIGAAQEGLLSALGILTCGDVLRNKELMVYLFPEKTAKKYLSMGLGTMRTHVERTLEQDAREKEQRTAAVNAFPKTAKATAKGKAPHTRVRPTGEKLRLRKSISKCATLYKRLRTAEEMAGKRHELFLKAHSVLRSEGLSAGTVIVAYTLNSFDTHTVQRCLPAATSSPAALEKALNHLALTVEALHPPTSIRCYGVGFTKLKRADA